MATPAAPVAPKPVAKPVTPPKKAALDEPAPAPTAMTDGHFTLQLSAFAAKRDADDFKRVVEAAGYHPFVVSSDVAGKGFLYRVRIGDYTDRESAMADKPAVEKRLGVSAYLAKI
jgi:cell division septation protein DedD